jgi:lipopolysaccharide biosynthesis glycosyltransferase
MYNLIFCLDKNYIKVLEFVLKSFKKTNNIKLYTLNFVIYDPNKNLHDKILKIANSISKKFIIKYNYFEPTEEFKTLLVEYSNVLFGDNEEIKQKRVFFNYSNWSRFHIVNLFPDIKKGLYLDLDILFCNKINDIFKINLTDHIVAVSPFNKNNESIIKKVKSLHKPNDPEKIEKFFNEFNINSKDLENKHYNCGVMLFNFELLKEFNMIEKVENLLKYMIQNPEIKLNGTQNVQNILIPKYKVFSSDYNKWRYKSVIYNKTKIVHYKGIHTKDLIDNKKFKKTFKNILKK